MKQEVTRIETIKRQATIRYCCARFMEHVAESDGFGYDSESKEWDIMSNSYAVVQNITHCPFCGSNLSGYGPGALNEGDAQ